MNEEQIRQAAEQSADPRIDLAVQRTELAEDRTLLAWLRTAMALIGTGAAFDKGTQLLHEQRVRAGTALVQGSHFVGLTLTASATLLLILVLWQHRKKHSELAQIRGGAMAVFPPTVWASVAVIFLGIAVFFVLILTN